MLKGNKKGKENNIPLESLENHFKKLNQNNLQNEDPFLQNDLHDESPLNDPITEDELDKAIKSLKNKKAAGADGIENEHIKSSFETFKYIYLKLFNVIIATGHFPDSWALGLIIPVFLEKKEI